MRLPWHIHSNMESGSRSVLQHIVDMLDAKEKWPLDSEGTNMRLKYNLSDLDQTATVHRWGFNLRRIPSSCHFDFNSLTLRTSSSLDW